MRRASLIFVLLLSFPSQAAPPANHPSAFPSGINAQPGSADFLTKLNTLLSRTDSSIQLARNQIAASPNAPFLPDLYEQLGELLLEKANALYFLRVEKLGKAAASAGPDRQVLSLQNEAITVFDKILEGFPNYQRRPNTLFLLASTVKAVDNIPRFIETVNTMIRDFPKVIETYRVRLLMGQHLMDRKIYDEALKHLETVRDCSFVFEKNLARYRMALIKMALEKPKDALTLFEDVVNDADLDQVKLDNAGRSLVIDRGSENLKREALIESTRAYTLLYTTDAKPVDYYLKLAPSEGLFQETIEKLAFRYLTLKQYSQAVFLFRVLSERLKDPERVLNIYRQALTTIPPKDRLLIPPSEMERVLRHFNRWTEYYQIPAPTWKSAYEFFETQVRDLGTRNHEESKKETDPVRKNASLTRAHDYYLLYLRFLQKTRFSSKIATNLADVYFNQKDYFHSGETYYRTYMGEFGTPEHKSELLKNAIFSFQQKGNYSFYEQLRARALLFKSIEGYQKENPRLRGDAKLNYVMIKTLYEQGFYDWAIPRLYSFVSTNKSTPYAPEAVDLILDYYNTLNDMKGLTAASGKLLAMNLPGEKLNQHLRQVQTTASFKRVESKIQDTLGYSDSAAGKQFLQAALSSRDSTLMDAALKEALALSKSERDIDTFFKSAGALIAKEQRPEKKADLLNSVVTENIKLTRFGAADQTLATISSLPGGGDAAKKAYQERIRVALLLRDIRLLSTLSDAPEWNGADEDLKKSTKALALDMLLSGAQPPESLLQKAALDGTDESTLQLLYRAKSVLPSQFRQSLMSSIQGLCQQRPQSPLCRWKALELAESRLNQFVTGLTGAPLVPESLEPKGAEFVQVDKLYREIEGSGDPYLDSLIAAKSFFLYSKFADFLLQVGTKNPSLSEPLKQKADESRDGARKFQQSCQNITSSASLPQRYGSYCVVRENVSLDTYFSRAVRSFKSRSGRDPMNKGILDLQKKLFAEEDRAKNLLLLSKTYFQMGEFSHAAGAAGYGISLNLDTADDLGVVLGCSLVELGFFNEAKFQLGKSKSNDPQRTKCLNEARNS